MRFIDPLMLGGLALLALPILIHLINRKRAIRRPFPALEFLLRSNKRLAKRLKLRQLLLLLLRILLFVLLPLAMARPYLLSDEGLTASERLPAAVVFILDDSVSMGQREAGQSAFDLAVQAIEDELGQLRPWDQVALVLAHSPPLAPVEELTEEHGRVRQAVAELAPTSRRGDLPAALEAAAQIHATGELPVRRTIVLSDDTAASWGARPPAPETLAQLGQLEVRSTRPGPARENTAIVGMAYTESSIGQEGSYDVWVEVQHFGAEGRAGVQVELSVDGSLVGTSVLDLTPEGTQTATFTLDLGTGGLHRAHAEVIVDEPDLPADNHRYLTLHLSREVRALLVNGDPRTVRYRDEVFYVERALHTGPADRSGIAVTVVGAEGIEADFFGYDVVVLANVASLPPARVAELTRFVREGGGLLFTAGNRVDADRYNRLFAELLPKRLRSVRELCDPRDPDANLLATRIARVDANHPVFRVFDLPGGESIQSVTVYSYLLLEPSPAGEATTLASYGDGGPALVERDFGAGRVALLTTTIDRDWTDLPIRTAFLPMMRRLMRYLARRGAAEGEGDWRVGERVVLDVEAQRPERVIVDGPNEDRRVLTPEPPDLGRVALEPEQPGHYAVSLDIAGLVRAYDELAFAVNVDTAESNLAAPDPALTAAIQAPAAQEGTAATVDVPERRVSLWPPLLFLVIVILYIESSLAVRRRMWQQVRGLFGQRSNA